jgi:hypothetical protein
MDTVCSGEITVAQHRDCPAQRVHCEWVDATYLYYRAHDCRVEGCEGQDFLALRHSGGEVCFALCDGVGQSFCGQLAARFLGTGLLDWLWTLADVSDAEEAAASCYAFLDGLRDDATSELAAFALPPDLPQMLQTALERQREYGSETTFVCGKLRWPDNPHEPSDCGFLMLCWLGDTKVELFDTESRPIDIGAHWTAYERWSMNRGIRGVEQIHSWVGNLEGLKKIIAYSDGLAEAADLLPDLIERPKDLQQEVERLGVLASSDDASLVGLEIRDLREPALAPVHNPWLANSYLLRWTEVPGAAGYTVEQARAGDFRSARTWTTCASAFACRSVEPGRCYYRVRATYGGLKSRGSNVRSALTLPWCRVLRLTVPSLILLGWMTVLTLLVLGVTSH